MARSIALSLAASEAGECYLLPELFTVQLASQCSERRVNLVTAVGQQDKERLSSTAPRQIMEEFQAGIITPMHILNDEQQGLLCGLAQEERAQGQRRGGVSPVRGRAMAKEGERSGQGKGV